LRQSYRGAEYRIAFAAVKAAAESHHLRDSERSTHCAFDCINGETPRAATSSRYACCRQY
jgi:hypothetical protein